MVALLAAGALGVAVVALNAGGPNPDRAHSAPTAGSAAPETVGSATPQPVGSAPASAPRHPPADHGRLVAEKRSVERVLGYTSYVQLAGNRRREVALTFDDGPSQYTPRILGVLRRMHAAATFFVIGRSVHAYPRFVGDEARAGCEVGDHTEAHPQLALLSPSAQTAQITQAAQDIRRAGAPSPVLMRPPYGSFSQTTLAILRAERMLMVLWSADTKDYTRPGVSRIVYTAVSGGRPGAIILMHDGGGDRSETVAALPRIILRLRQRGFRLVTISQLIADDPPPAHQRPPHPL
ncbi:MAG TPA: polysaccharide deacetylase family protein [Solirubrobacteraceae bacterium]|nr:polysaccharide deacetylase family protein [Solirubrobacteraceae bacterium]